MLRQLEAMTDAERGDGWFFADALAVPRSVLDAPLELSACSTDGAEEHAAHAARASATATAASSA